MYKKIVERIAELTEAKGLKASDVADRAGIKRPAYSKLMNGVIDNPTLNTLCKIADALEVSPRELFPNEDKECFGVIEYNGSTRVVRSIEELKEIMGACSPE